MEEDSVVFFFSCRRRHTILQGDWSSDVCSSDLRPGLFLLDLRVIEVVALALRVVARHAAADPVLREPLLRIAAILLFALRFGGFLFGFLGRLCLILLALAERLFLLGRGLGSGALDRLAFCRIIGR